MTLLVAVYFALGTPTKRSGLDDVADYYWQHNSIYGHTEYVAPLLVKCQSTPLTFRFNGGKPRIAVPPMISYHTWFFGVRLAPS